MDGGGGCDAGGGGGSNDSAATDSGDTTHIGAEHTSISLDCDVQESRLDLSLEPAADEPSGTDNPAFVADEPSEKANGLNGNATKEKEAEAVNLELVNMAPAYTNGTGYSIPVNGVPGIPVKKEVEAEASTPYDEYFVPVNEHRKYMRPTSSSTPHPIASGDRGEKLYVTKDKRQSPTWRRCCTWWVGCSVVAVIVIIAILAGAGVLNMSQEPSLVKEASIGRTFVGNQLPTEEAKSSVTPIPTSPTNLTFAPTTDMTYMYVPHALEGELRIDNLEMTPNLENKHSADYKMLVNELEEKLKTTLFSYQVLNYGSADISLKIIDLRPGSVIVTYRVAWMFKSGLRNPPDPITKTSMDEKIQDALRHNDDFLGDYHIDSSSVKVSNVIDTCQMDKGACPRDCEFDYITSLTSQCTCPDGQSWDTMMKSCVHSDEQEHSHEDPKAEPEPEPSSHEQDHSHEDPKAEPEPSPSSSEQEHSREDPKAEPEPSPSLAEHEHSHEDPKAEPEPSPSSQEHSHEDPKAEPEPSPSLAEHEHSHEDPKAEPEPSPSSQGHSHENPKAEPEPSPPLAEHEPSHEDPKAEPAPSLTEHENSHEDPNAEPAPLLTEHEHSHEDPKAEPEPSLSSIAQEHSHDDPKAEPEPSPSSTEHSHEEPKAEPEPSLAEHEHSHEDPKAEPEPSLSSIAQEHSHDYPKAEPEPSPSSTEHSHEEPEAEPEPSLAEHEHSHEDPKAEPEPSPSLTEHSHEEPKAEPEPSLSEHEHSHEDPKAEPEPSPSSTAQEHSHDDPKAEPGHSPFSADHEIISHEDPKAEPEPSLAEHEHSHEDPKAEPASSLVEPVHEDLEENKRDKAESLPALEEIHSHLTLEHAGHESTPEPLPESQTIPPAVHSQERHGESMVKLDPKIDDREDSVMNTTPSEDGSENLHHVLETEAFHKEADKESASLMHRSNEKLEGGRSFGENEGAVEKDKEGHSHSEVDVVMDAQEELNENVSEMSHIEETTLKETAEGITTMPDNPKLEHTHQPEHTEPGSELKFSVTTPPPTEVTTKEEEKSTHDAIQFSNGQKLDGIIGLIREETTIRTAETTTHSARKVESQNSHHFHDDEQLDDNSLGFEDDDALIKEKYKTKGDTYDISTRKPGYVVDFTSMVPEHHEEIVINEPNPDSMQLSKTDVKHSLLPAEEDNSFEDEDTKSTKFKKWKGKKGKDGKYFEASDEHSNSALKNDVEVIISSTTMHPIEMSTNPLSEIVDASEIGNNGSHVSTEPQEESTTSSILALMGQAGRMMSKDPTDIIEVEEEDVMITTVSPGVTEVIDSDTDTILDLENEKATIDENISVMDLSAENDTKSVTTEKSKDSDVQPTEMTHMADAGVTDVVKSDEDSNSRNHEERKSTEIAESHTADPIPSTVTESGSDSPTVSDSSISPSVSESSSPDETRDHSSEKPDEKLTTLMVEKREGNDEHEITEGTDMMTTHTPEMVSMSQSTSTTEMGMSSSTAEGTTESASVQPRISTEAQANETTSEIDNISGFFSKCAAAQFECKNGTSGRGSPCVSLSAKCDSVNDCSDGSDESGCIESGCPGNFQCSDGQCLKRHMVCNGIPDCAGGSDEENCESWKCEFDEFRCPSGRCIPIVWQCDGKPDCDGHADEFNCQDSCGNEEYLCPERWCIPMTYRCNGQKDCANGEDEALCDCSLDQYRCESGGCVSKSQVCDGIGNCPDRSDEWQCYTIENGTDLLRIRSADGAYSPVCADRWTSTESDLVCRSLGYAYSTSSEQGESLRSGTQESHLVLTGQPTQSVLTALTHNTGECESGRFVETTCQEFTCGSHSMSQGLAARLVGDSAMVGQWPSVALMYNTKNSHTCTASIITPRWAIASYNCLLVRNKNINEQDWRLWSGSTRFESTNEGQNITAILPYPQARFNQFLYDNDVALVELAGALSFSPDVGAVCLPEKEIEPRQLCVTAGWGVSSVKDGSLTQYLHYLPVPTTDRESCNSTKNYAGVITNDKICAGFTGTSKSLCSNDEGAPLMCVSSSGSWELHGVLSYHSNCGRGSRPSIFSDITSVRQWIEKTTGTDFDRIQGAAVRRR